MRARDPTSEDALSFAAPVGADSTESTNNENGVKPSRRQGLVELSLDQFADQGGRGQAPYVERVGDIWIGCGICEVARLSAPCAAVSVRKGDQLPLQWKSARPFGAGRPMNKSLFQFSGIYIMRTKYQKMQFAILALMVAGAASAVDRSTAADAVEYMKKAQAYVKKNGMEKSFVEFNSPEGRFNSKSDINKIGDLYIFSIDPNGFQAVHKNSRIRGTNQMSLFDQDGVHLVREFVKLCFSSKEGKGWVNYRWPNPVSKEMEAKSGYVERVPGTDLCLGTGIYK